MKTVCQLDTHGVFVGLVDADPSPLEPGVYLLPAGAIDTAEPAVGPGQIARWVNGAWLITDRPAPAVTPKADAVPEAEQTLEQRLASYTNALQRRLDDFAATRGYSSILSACSYATSSVPRFQVEGTYCAALRDATWHQCYQILDEVQAGTRTAPSYEELLAELPTPQWPA